MAEYWEFSNVSDVVHTMSKEHGAVHGEEEDYPPPDLAAGALSIIGKVSS